MSRKPIGSDFVRRRYKRLSRCSECGVKIPANTVALISIRGGRVMKRVCGEDCRQEFDSRFWQAQAAKRRRQ